MLHALTALLLVAGAGACATELDDGASAGSSGGKADDWNTGFATSYADYLERASAAIGRSMDAVIDRTGSPHVPDDFFDDILPIIATNDSKVRQVEAAERDTLVDAAWATTAITLLHEFSARIEDTWDLYDAGELEWAEVVSKMHALQALVADEVKRARANAGPTQDEAP